MIQVMNILNGVMPAKSDGKSTDKKIVDFKSIIKVVQNGNKNENKKFNNGGNGVVDNKQLASIINLILNLINNNLISNKSSSQSDLQSLSENIINQLYNAVQSSQNTDTFNLKNIVNTVTKVLNEEFGLNIDSKDVLNLLKNSKTNDVKILPNSGVVEVGNSKIESKLSVNSDGTKQQMMNGKDTKIDVVNDKKNVNINSLDIKVGNSTKDENLNQNENNNDNKGETADESITDKIQNNIAKKDENKSNLLNDNKIINLKTDNIVMLNDNQNKQLTISTDKTVNVKSSIQETNIIDQIVKNVNITKSDTESNIKIQLKPDFLGKIEIDIKSVDGSLTANILTDNEKVKHQIEANLNILNSQLESKGIKIDSFNVSIDRNMQFTSQYNGQENSGERYKNQNHNRIRFNYDDDYKTAELESHSFSAVNTTSSDHVDVVV